MTTLAIDLGTSATKFLRVDSDLRILSADRVPAQGLAPDAWLAAIRSNLLARGDGHLIERIAITGQMHGLVTLEDNGYGESIPWTDQHGATIATRLNEELGPTIIASIGGPLASGFQAVSLAWLKAHNPDRWQRIHQVMLPKDALLHALTGKHVTDPSDAVGTGLFDVSRGDWAAEIIDTIDIPYDWLPRIVPSGTVVGRVLSALASHLGLRPGTPIVIAGGDAPVGAVGAGVTQIGQALVMLSSGAQIITPVKALHPDPAGGWYTWPAARPENSSWPRFLRVGTLLNAGIATDWLRRTLSDPHPIATSPSRLVVLPHLIGERTPLADANARGAILGITRETSPEELSRAMLEGIAYSIRHALEIMTVDCAQPKMIRLGGGGAQNDIGQSIITNVLALPTAQTTTCEISALGAAALALAHSVPETAHHRVQPEPALVAEYDERYQIYRHALEAVTPTSLRLAALERPS